MGALHLRMRAPGHRPIAFASPGALAMYDRSPFATLLETAIVKKPQPRPSETGYREMLELMKRGGEYQLAGLELEVPRGVYPPRPGSSTEFFLRNWSAAGLSESAGSLLDLRTGSGALALHAARRGWYVTGSDIDPQAVNAARRNARNNRLEVDFVCSDLFEAFEHCRFDAITFTSPFVPKPAVVHPGGRALASADGELTRRLLDQASEFLRPGGKVVFAYSNCSDDRLLDRDDWTFELVACDYEALGQSWRALLVATPNPGKKSAAKSRANHQ
jgi:methylase of polypeptide subunit release factors